MTFLTNFKGPRVTEKERRAAKRKKVVAAVKSAKRQVRERDLARVGGCRFPGCLCFRRHLMLEVAHLEHQGMGGNPKLDRSAIDKMILLCPLRHRASVFSLDQGNLRCRPLTLADGTNGLVAWDVSLEMLRRYASHLTLPAAGDWLLLAEEVDGGGRHVEPAVVAWLSTMTC